MGERKKLTMYYPPDFDPRLVPRAKRDPNFVCEVRMMLPFSVQCNTCGEFMYMGKKFNSRKENAQGEKYKGIQILRFYIRCQTCGAEMSFKTDPENGDYVMESGGSRTYEVWKEKNKIAEDNLQERLDEDQQDAMKALENKTMDSRLEMDTLDQLDELKALSQRNQRVDTDSLLDRIRPVSKDEPAKLGDDDEALIASINFASKPIDDFDQFTEPHDSEESESKKRKADTGSALDSMVKRQLSSKAEIPATSVIKRKKKVPKQERTESASSVTKPEENKQEEPSSPQGMGLLAAYGSDDSS